MCSYVSIARRDKSSVAQDALEKVVSEHLYALYQIVQGGKENMKNMYHLEGML